MTFMKVVHYLKCSIRVIFVFLNNLYCIPTYLLWMVLLTPLKLVSSNLYWGIEGIAFHWLLYQVALWSWTAGYTILEVGDDVSDCYEDESLVIVNHQSTADVPLLMQSFVTKPTVTSNVVWIMDRMFRYTNFGYVSVMHKDFFISCGKEVRDQSLKALEGHINNVYGPLQRKWIVLFPEGGFLRNRIESSQKYAQKNNLPDLKLVALPRVGAMQIIVKCLNSYSVDVDGVNNQRYTKSDRNPLKWVIDITVGYPGGKPLDLLTIISGSRPPCQTVFYYKKYSIHEIPKDEKSMTDWLYNRFIEKEKMLEEFYRTGSFPHMKVSSGGAQHQVINLSWSHALLRHFIFLLSSYVHCRMIYWLWSTLVALL